MMPKQVHTQPKAYYGVTVSSTFTDLQQHRAALIKAIHAHGMKAVTMENDAGKLTDIISSSLNMVAEGAVYVCIIGMKYGQVPPDPKRNPKNLSITELEFNEALRLNRPILLFIMGDDHPVTRKDIEPDAEKANKLNAFRERAKEMGEDLKVHRVYATFNSLQEFERQLGTSLVQANNFIEEHVQGQAPTIVDTPAPPATTKDPIPHPPHLYAEPPYVGSHQFVGRQAQIDQLNDWARPADTNAILLFDAIGGMGKSMLTWHWTTQCAPANRDWAGIFWYSFYEKGAVMAGFCRHALAYVTCQPLEAFQKQKTAEMGKLLLRYLQDKPYLFVLDGLERLLVSYHRIDAAELPDDEVDSATDQIAQRDPIACIRDEDDDLLKLLATATPSKILVSTRLMPRVLMNQGNQPIPGVTRFTLTGLRPAEAEEFFRNCDISGDSATMQDYLTTNCACHPLTMGVLAGIINHFLPARGNFDAWFTSAEGAIKLNLAELNIEQKRNHILKAALRALPDASRQLLSTIALIGDAVDYEMLAEFNPHPDNSTKKLSETIEDLEMRGLLQYDHATRRYDLHPVVRGIAAGNMGDSEKERYGQKVVDFFNSQPHSPYEEAETMAHVQTGIATVRTLLKMGKYQQACNVYCGDLSNALQFNLEAYKEVLALLRPFFPNGWGVLPPYLDSADGSYLANDAAIALQKTASGPEVLAAFGACMVADMERENLGDLFIRISNFSNVMQEQNKLSPRFRLGKLALRVAEFGDRVDLFAARLNMFYTLATLGRYDEAAAIWAMLHPMGSNWSRGVYQPGNAEHQYAQFLFAQGKLEAAHLAKAERLASDGKNRTTIRYLLLLRGKWHLEQKEWQAAADSLSQAVTLAREVQMEDPTSETLLALAKYHLGQLPNAEQEAERLSNAGWLDELALAELWLAIGNQEQAKKHALAAYKVAWADGEPYVFRYELNKATALLHQLGVPLPQLPPYDPAKDIPFPWEAQVEALLEKERREREEKRG